MFIVNILESIVKRVAAEPVVIFGLLGIAAAVASVHYNHTDFIPFIALIDGALVRNRVSPAGKAATAAAASVVESIDPAAAAAVAKVTA